MNDKYERAEHILVTAITAPMMDEIYKPELSAALDAVETIVDTLIKGIPSKAAMLLLARFLEDRDHAKQFAKEQLGASLLGKSSVAHEEYLASETFKLALECAYTEAEALILAYDTYHDARSKRTGEKPRTYSGDFKKPAERGKYPSNRTMAENTMDETIRPFLKKMGCAVTPRKSPGRPPRKPLRKGRT